MFGQSYDAEEGFDTEEMLLLENFVQVVVPAQEIKATVGEDGVYLEDSGYVMLPVRAVAQALNEKAVVKMCIRDRYRGNGYDKRR